MSPKRCPNCGERGTCLYTRHGEEHVWRRYKCQGCKQRWSTYEVFVTEKDLEEEPADG